MAKKISAGIGLDGEKEFRQAVNAINSDLNVLKSEMELVTSEFADNKNSIEALTAKQKLFEKQIESQKDKISEYEKMLKQTKSALDENKNVLPQYEQKLKDAKAALEQTTAEYGKNSKEVKAAQSALKEAEKDYKNLTTQISKQEKSITDYTVSVNKAKTDINKMNRELAEIEKQAVGIDKVNDELKELANNADNADEKTSGLSDSAGKFGDVAKAGAAAAVTAFAAVSAAVSAVAVELAQLTVSSAAYADEILTSSVVTGVSTEALQAYTYAAELVDVSTETLTASMAKQVKSMSGAADGSKAYAEAYKTLKVSVTDSTGALRDSEEVYWETIDALGKIENETERDALAMQIFGKSARELNPLIEQGSEGIAKLTDEAKRMGAVLSDETLSELGEFDNSIQRLTAGGNAAKNALGTLLLPQLQTLSNEGVSLIGNFTNGLLEADGNMEKVGDVVAETIESALGIVSDMLPEFLDLGADVLDGLIKGISGNLSSGDFSATASSIIESILTSITDVLPELGTGSIDIVLTITESILEQLPEIVNSGSELMLSFVTGIGDSIPDLIPVIAGVITEIVTILSDPENLSELLTAAMTIISELGFALMDSIPQLINAAMKVITNLCSFILDPANLATILTTALELILALGSGIVSSIPELLVSVFELIAGIFKTFTDTDWGDIGINIVDGLLNGLKNSWENLKKWFSNAFESLKQSVEDIFDIHSPSRWASDDVVGNIMNGFVVGFDRDAPKVKHKFDEFMMTLTDDVEYSIGISSINAQISPADISEYSAPSIEFITDELNSLNETEWDETGKNIVDTLLSGLKDEWKNLDEWFAKSLESLKQRAENLSDINVSLNLTSDDVVGDIMNSFVVGFDRDAPKVKQKFDSFMMTMTEDLEYKLRISDINAQIASADIPESALVPAPVQPEPTYDDKFDRMLALLEIIAMNSKKDILIDKKTLVAEIVPEVNEELGDILVMQERGA